MNCIPKDLKNGKKICVDVISANSDDSNADTLQPLFPHVIVGFRVRGIVAASINLNGEAQGRTIYVDDVATDTKLPKEFQTKKPPVPKLLPKEIFRLRS